MLLLKSCQNQTTQKFCDGKDMNLCKLFLPFFQLFVEYKHKKELMVVYGKQKEEKFAKVYPWNIGTCTCVVLLLFFFFSPFLTTVEVHNMCVRIVKHIGLVFLLFSLFLCVLCYFCAWKAWLWENDPENMDRAGPLSEGGFKAHNLSTANTPHSYSITHLSGTLFPVNEQAALCLILSWNKPKIKYLSLTVLSCWRCWFLCRGTTPHHCGIFFFM